MPVELVDEAMALIAAKGGAFRYVPEIARTARVCLIAVQLDGNDLGLVPFKLRTLELCFVALRQSRWAYNAAPYELRKTAGAYLKLIGKE